jgi:uncharacterized protein with PIN domain
MIEDIRYTDFDFSGSIVECHTCGGYLRGPLAKEVDLVLNFKDSFSEKVWLCPKCNEDINKGKVIKPRKENLHFGDSII